MKRRSALVIAAVVAAALLAALVSAAASSPPPSGDSRLDRAIGEANAEWAAAMKTGDAAAIARPYLDDAVFVGADGACIRGRAAVETLYRDRFRRGGLATATRIEPRRVVLDGDLAYESGYGEMTMTKDGKPATGGGRYLTVWKRVAGGDWKILRNVVLP